LTCDWCETGGKDDHAEASGDRTDYVSMDNKANPARGSRGIVCMREEVMPIDAQNCFIPCHLI